jgi:HEAT repeat protein
MLLARLHPGAHHLLRPMLEDRDPEVRLVTCAALAASRDPQAVMVLLDAIENERLAPERVIERIGAEWAVDALLAAVAAVPHDRAATRLAVTRALGLAGSRAAEPALLELLCEGTEEVRISAARSLGQVGGPASRAELERALEEESWPLRAQAAKALGTIGQAASVPALEERLADSAWWVRANAAQALVDLGPEGVEALERAADHDDPYARDRAREALALANVTGAAV